MAAQLARRKRVSPALASCWYCGEFGVFPLRSKPEHRSRWFRDFAAVLAENRIGWAVWGWDEGFELNRQMVNGQPVIDAVVAQALGLKT
jgi:hypothetical protein